MPRDWFRKNVSEMTSVLCGVGHKALTQSVILAQEGVGVQLGRCGGSSDGTVG